MCKPDTLTTQFMKTIVVEGSTNILPFFYTLCSANEVNLTYMLLLICSPSALVSVPR